MNKKKLNKIRIKLDRLDSTLLKIIKKRTSLVNLVLKEKTLKNQIIDNKRIKVILKKIRLKSIKLKIDPQITNKIWKAMIRAFIDYEFRNFKK